MENMKKLGLAILLGFMILLSGCFDDQDGYSLNDVWIGFGMIQGNSSLTIRMDNGEVLIPVANSYHDMWYHDAVTGEWREITAGDRILVNFTILDDKKDSEGKIVSRYVKINSIKKVLMKGILDITAENEDSIGNNAIHVQDCWVTDSLLNFQLKYWGRNKLHYINLVKQPGQLSSSSQPVELELRHNNNGDDEVYPYIAYVSFRLDKIRIAGLDSVQFKITGKDYNDGDFVFKGTYKH